MRSVRWRTCRPWATTRRPSWRAPVGSSRPPTTTAPPARQPGVRDSLHPE
jgi:hypothetical protein